MYFVKTNIQNIVIPFMLYTWVIETLFKLCVILYLEDIEVLFVAQLIYKTSFREWYVYLMYYDIFIKAVTCIFYYNYHYFICF